MIEPNDLTGKTISYGNATYQFLEIEGKGGFAYVYKARRIQALTQTVAIKVLNEKYARDEKWRTYFKQEAEAHSRVSGSPQVASLFELIDGDKESITNLDMMVMEWVDGTSLDKWILLPTVQFADRLDVALQLCRGLMTIHGENRSVLKGFIAHGDITPANILITPDHEAKIIDFGLAWDILDENVTIERKNAGTVSFIAPEQILNPDSTNTNRMADVFSLGAVFYLLFSRNHYHPELVAAESGWRKQEGLTSSRDDLKVFGDLILNHKPSYFQIEDVSDVKIVQQLNDVVLTMLISEVKEREHRVGSVKQVWQRLGKIRDNLPQNKINVVSNNSEAQFFIWVARQDGDRLSNYRLGLQESYHKGRRFLVSTYLNTLNQNIKGILMDSHNNVLDKAYFRPAQREFYFFADITDNVKPHLEIRYGERLLQSPPETFDLDITIKRDKPIDILFILDRSISSNYMESHVRPFIQKLLKQINASNRPYELKCCFYGEYRRHPYSKYGESWNINFDVVWENNIKSAPDFYRFVDFILQKEANLQEKSYCGSLELALLKAADGSIIWSDDIPSYIIIIGASPPHPTTPLQLEYALSDYSTEEFSISEDWLYLVDYLRKQGVRFAHLWLPFTNITGFPIKTPENMMNYIEMFGEYLNSDDTFHNIDERFYLSREVDRIFKEIYALDPYRLTKPCDLPLLQRIQLNGL